MTISVLAASKCKYLNYCIVSAWLSMKKDDDAMADWVSYIHYNFNVNKDFCEN